MGYNKKTWKERIAERSDLSTQVVHLTREGISIEAKKISVSNVLFEIINSGTIRGSNTDSGFICGDTPAVCFQDAPLHAICQNVFFEQKFKKSNSNQKTRYRAVGLAFSKDYIYQNGGRPVIYDKTHDAKEYLPPSEWWRIVNFDLEDPKSFIDWTHEREWRIPNNFKFDLEEITLLFVNAVTYNSFIKLCDSKQKDYIKNVKGVVVMDNLLY